jgi:CRP-like cAMP-binding protein
MSLGTDVAILRRVPFFRDFTEEHMRLVAFSAESLSLLEGAVLYSERQALDSAYVVMAGIWEAQRGAGARALVREVAVGELLAPRALIVEAQAHETVRAASAARALQIRRPVFRRLLEAYPDITAALRARLAEGLVAASDDLRRTGRRIGAVRL